MEQQPTSKPNSTSSNPRLSREHANQAQRTSADIPPSLSPSATTEHNVLHPVKRLFFRQLLEFTPAFVGLQTECQYRLCTESGETCLLAGEVLRSRMFQWLSTSTRPFYIVIVRSSDNSKFLTLERPFRFLFHLLRVFNSKHEQIGAIVKTAQLDKRCFRVFDAKGVEVFTIFGNICRPRTFQIYRTSTIERVACIKKQNRKNRYSASFPAGLLSRDEILSPRTSHQRIIEDPDSDDDIGLSIEFPEIATAVEKQLLVGATFLLEKLYLEDWRKIRNSSINYY